jgi:hypothetical protein
MTPSQRPSLEKKTSVNSTTSVSSTERKSSIGDISSLSDLLKKKKKDARRAEIVAAVTKRLYNAKKVEMKPEPVEVVREQEYKQDDDAEPDELKLCQRARTRLRELSKKVLQAQRSRIRRFSDTEAQTDFDAHVLRVKEVAVSTEELNCSPSLFLPQNRGLLLKRYAYSMRQEPAWSTLLVRNGNKHLDEDSFSDDSLDSTHAEGATEEKPSVWNVITISSGKQFKTNRVDSENDQRFRDISTQTQVSFYEKDITMKVPYTETDNFNIRSKDIFGPDHTNQPEVMAKVNQLSSCLQKDMQEQASTYAITCDSTNMDTATITEGTFLQLSDHHLYTITENTEKCTINDVISAEYDNSNTKQTNGTVTEKCENNLGNMVSFPDTCSCRTLRSTCGSHHFHAPEFYTNYPSPDLMTDLHTLCFQACTMYTKPGHDRKECKDKMSQTTPELYPHNHTKKSTSTSQKTTIQTYDNSNKDVIKCSENRATLYWTNRKICKHCKKLVMHLCNTDDSTKLLPAHNTKTEGTQYALTHLSVEAGTQTGLTQFPNITLIYSTLLGDYPQLQQLSNPILQSEDCTAIFFPSHTSHLIIMKPIHGSNNQPSNSVRVQTDKNMEQMCDDENKWSIETKCCNDKKYSGMQQTVPEPQRRVGLQSTSIYQHECGKSASQQMTNTPETCSKGSHTRSMLNSKTFMSVPLNLDSEASHTRSVPDSYTSTCVPANLDSEGSHARSVPDSNSSTSVPVSPDSEGPYARSVHDSNSSTSVEINMDSDGLHTRSVCDSNTSTSLQINIESEGPHTRSVPDSNTPTSVPISLDSEGSHTRSVPNRNTSTSVQISLDSEWSHIRNVPDSNASTCVPINLHSEGPHTKSMSESNTSTSVPIRLDSEGPHTRSVPDSKTSASAPISLDNFSDDEDVPCLPYVTVTPTEKTEASGSQHMVDIRNLILGRDRNMFPYNATTGEEDHLVRKTKNIKKKSVSWSDLSGCGALHTEMVFTSDHNLYDSSQVPLNKIVKNSLLNAISAEMWRLNR